jgi:hypothetical protein
LISHGTYQTDSGTDKVRSLGYNNSKAAIVSFGDLKNGEYSSKLRLLSGQIDDVTIISNSGRVLAR